MSSSTRTFNNNRSGLTQEGFDVYRKYCALKAHFSSGYDYFKSGGNTRVKRSSFIARPDAAFFTHLANTSDDYFGILLSNILHDPKTWIGDMEAEKVNDIYKDWKKRNEQIEYYFQVDVNSLKDVFSDNFSVDNKGNYPYILELALENEINFETFSILTKLLALNKLWDKKLSDEFLAPKVIERAVNYHPFISYNRDRFKEIIVSRWKKL